jgi:hypothetical protein
MKLRLLSLVLILLLVACGSADDGEEFASPRDIILEFDQAINEGDIDAVMALISNEATWDSWDGDIYIGQDEVREYLQSLIDDGFQQVLTIRTSDPLGVSFRLECTLPGESFNAQGALSVKEGKITSIGFDPRF